MNQRTKAGTVDLQAAFTEWVRKNAYNPGEAIDHFLQKSDYMRGAVDTVVEHARGKIIERTRGQLERLTEDAVYVAQFPMVYACKDMQDRDVRYTVSLTLHDGHADWVGRVWSDGEYLGEVHGSGSGPQANYVELARMHIESHVQCAGGFEPRLRKA